MADAQEVEFEQFSTIVVYETDTGRIVVIHHHAMPRGADRPDRKELETQVIRHAVRSGINTSKMLLLHVDPGKLQRGATYRVDVTSKSLIKIPKPR